MRYLIIALILLMQNAYADSLKIIVNSPIDQVGPNQKCDQEICKTLLDLINESKSSIDFAIYGLRGQPEILDALINADQRGILIRGIVDKKLDGTSYYSDTEKLEEAFPEKVKSDHEHDLLIKKKYFSKNKTYSDNKNCNRPINTKGPLQCFMGQGYASKEEIEFTGDIMHNKFFIVDNKYVWTGSANISDTGIGGYNANVVAIVESDFIASRYLIEFNQMYIKGDFHKSKKELLKENISTNINQKDVSLFFSPQGWSMYHGVIPIIEAAKETIDVSIFFLTHNNATEALLNAHNRGVEVRVIIDATGAGNEYSKHQVLRDHGIEVKVENWGGKMHMKSAIIDKKNIIVGSMNWTNAGSGEGVTKNDENTLIIKNDIENSKYLTNHFNEMWTSIPNKWLVQDPEAESLESVNSCFDGSDNDFDEMIDGYDSECR